MLIQPFRLGDEGDEQAAAQPFPLMIGVDIDGMFDGVAKAVKGAPVAEGGVTGNHPVFFAHQHGITGYLPGFEPGNTVVGIDGFVVPDGGGMDDRMVVDFSDCRAIVFAGMADAHGNPQACTL